MWTSIGLRLVPVLGLLLIGVSLDIGTATPNAREVEAVATPIPVDECIWCDKGEVCISGWHLALDPDGDPEEEDSYRAGGPHNGGFCREGECHMLHGPCPPDPGFTHSTIEALRAGIFTEDTAVVSKLLDEQPKAVVLNDHRSAIQVLDCRGAVSMHLPLSEGLITSLQAARSHE